MIGVVMFVLRLVPFVLNEGVEAFWRTELPPSVEEKDRAIFRSIVEELCSNVDTASMLFHHLEEGSFSMWQREALIGPHSSLHHLVPERHHAECWSCENGETVLDEATGEWKVVVKRRCGCQC